MAYTADPENSSIPTDSQFVGHAAAELRALKWRVTQVKAALESQLELTADTLSQTGATNLAAAVNSLTNSINSLLTSFNTHAEASNPHGATKSTFDLGNVNNFGATSSLGSNTGTLYLLDSAGYELAQGILTLNQIISDLETAIAAAFTSRDASILAVTNNANNAQGRIDGVIEDFNEYKDRTSQIITVANPAVNVRNISNGSTNLLTAYRTMLKPGIYTVHANISTNTNGTSVVAGLNGRISDTFVVTHDMIYAGSPPGANVINSSGARRMVGVTCFTLGSMHGFDAIPCLALEITSPTTFSFIGRSQQFSSESYVATYYANIARITFTPL